MPLKIMIVENDAASVKLMRALATPLNHTVIALEDAEKARQRAEEMRFDAVFIGMRLAELDGIELAHQIRDSRFNMETTIVMLSAADDIEGMRRAFGEGANYILSKPLDGVRLRKMLSAMESPAWRGIRSARLPLFTQVHCTCGTEESRLQSMNISESGMLLQPGIEAEVGQEILLEFQIVEVRSSLRLRASVVRKEGTERFAVEFIDLAPEDRNAVQLYVMGRLASKLTPERETPGNIWVGKGFFR